MNTIPAACCKEFQYKLLNGCLSDIVESVRSKEVMNMTSHKGELYYCEICGAEVKVEKGGDGSLTCCGQAMVIKET